MALAVKRRRRSAWVGHCDGKRRFRDLAQAKRALRRVREGDERQKTPCRAYACDRCHGAHLTSQPS